VVLDARLAESLRSAVAGSGMTVGVPEFVAALLVRLFDRMFEFVFTVERTEQQQEEIVLTFVDIIASYIERFATPAALEGISAEEFVRALGEDPSAIEAQ
jgi:hypothetical protein